MKFLFPVALATFVAVASAIWTEGLGSKESCAALEANIPSCAITCVNRAAAKLCTLDDIECGCSSENLKTIIDMSAQCVSDACIDAWPVFPPIREWCNCRKGDDSISSISSNSSVALSETTTISSSSSSSESSSSTAVETYEPTTTPPSYSTLTSTYTTTTVSTITSCGRNVTSCTYGGEVTATLTLTTTWCPESENPPLPTPTAGAPGTGAPVYPAQQPGGPGYPGPGYPGTTYVPSATPTNSSPPFTGAGAFTKQNSGLLAGVVVAIAGLAWL